MVEKDEWEKIWDTRVNALSDVLGQTIDNIYHAPHPFKLGGNADVICFREHLKGFVYVTADLTGTPEYTYTDYELMICTRNPDNWAPNIISRIAPYTQQAVLHHGDTMDISSAVPATSRIKGFLFLSYNTFEMFREVYELRLCIGITQKELEFKLEHGFEKLDIALRENNVFPFTDLDRGDIELPYG